MTSGWKQEYGAHTQRQVMLSSGWFSLKTGKTGHRIRTSYSSLDFQEIYRVFRPNQSVRFDLAISFISGSLTQLTTQTNSSAKLFDEVVNNR